MAIIHQLAFYLAVVAYVMSALAALRYMRNQDEPYMTWANRFMAAGAVLMSISLIFRGLRWNLVPLTTAIDSGI